jgi:hypothetical protein
MFKLGWQESCCVIPSSSIYVDLDALQYTSTIYPADANAYATLELHIDSELLIGKE